MTRKRAAIGPVLVTAISALAALVACGGPAKPADSPSGDPESSSDAPESSPPSTNAGSGSNAGSTSGGSSGGVDQSTGPLAPLLYGKRPADPATDSSAAAKP